MHPVTRQIILGGAKIGAAEAFAAFYRLESCAAFARRRSGRSTPWRCRPCRRCTRSSKCSPIPLRSTARSAPTPISSTCSTYARSRCRPRCVRTARPSASRWLRPPARTRRSFIGRAFHAATALPLGADRRAATRAGSWDEGEGQGVRRDARYPHAEEPHLKARPRASLTRVNALQAPPQDEAGRSEFPARAELRTIAAARDAGATSRFFGMGSKPSRWPASSPPCARAGMASAFSRVLRSDGLFVRLAALHLAKDALALQLLFEHSQSLIDIVVADDTCKIFPIVVVAPEALSSR